MNSLYKISSLHSNGREENFKSYNLQTIILQKSEWGFSSQHCDSEWNIDSSLWSRSKAAGHEILSQSFTCGNKIQNIGFIRKTDGYHFLRCKWYYSDGFLEDWYYYQLRVLHFKTQNFETIFKQKCKKKILLQYDNTRSHTSWAFPEAIAKLELSVLFCVLYSFCAMHFTKFSFHGHLFDWNIWKIRKDRQVVAKEIVWRYFRIAFRSLSIICRSVQEM